LSEENVADPQTSESWTSSLPDDLQGDPTLNRYKSIESMAKSFLEQRSKMGGMISIPHDGSTSEERSGFYQKIGAPDTAEGYALPEGVDDRTASVLKELRSSALEDGVTVKAWERLVSKVSTSLKVPEDHEGKVAALEAAARDEFGVEYDAVVVKSERVIEALKEDIPELGDFLKENGNGNNPIVLKLMQKVSSLVSDDNIPAGSGDSSPEERGTDLANKIRGLFASEEYKDRAHPLHKKAKADYLNMTKDLLEAGFEGIHDSRLQP